MYHASQVSLVGGGVDNLDPFGSGRSSGPCPCLATSRPSSTGDSLAVSVFRASLLKRSLAGPDLSESERERESL